MKKVPLIIFLVWFITSAYSQIKFEKGYFIDNDGKRVECLIKNNDWVKNPTEIEYKLDEDAGTMRITALSVREFGIDNSSKYVSSTVNIDMSEARISHLTVDPNPIFKEERLFLKVLVKGKANLYLYEDEHVRRFFYHVDESQIEQLIYKVYYGSYQVGSTNKISENNRFRQQLWNSLTCSSIDRKKLENLDYKKNTLVKVFSEYNICSGSESSTFEDKVKRNIFTISLRPRLNYSSLDASNAMDPSNKFDWGNKQGFGIGIEGEFFLPMNKDKWSVVIEPTYQGFSGRTTSADYSSPGSMRVAHVDYKSIEVPVGIRHYFFLSDISRIFVNASYVFDFSSSSQLRITRESGYQLHLLKIKSGRNFSFGAGFKHKAIGIEVRYQTAREILFRHILWASEYNALSIVLGYSITRKKS